jgi:hypothetical protein
MRTAVSAKSSRGSETSSRAKTASLSLVLPVLLVLSCKSVEPLPEPEPPAREAVISWEITPPKGYYANSGFVTLDFTPPEALNDQKESPLGGRLTVHLGYLNIRNANTLWYRFEVAEGSRYRLRIEGEDNIPNVKDPDEYWWNDLDLDLNEPVTGEIRVIVTDKRIDTAYRFTLRKVITYP